MKCFLLQQVVGGIAAELLVEVVAEFIPEQLRYPQEPHLQRIMSFHPARPTPCDLKQDQRQMHICILDVHNVTVRHIRPKGMEYLLSRLSTSLPCLHVVFCSEEITGIAAKALDQQHIWPCEYRSCVCIGPVNNFLLLLFPVLHLYAHAQESLYYVTF